MTSIDAGDGVAIVRSQTLVEVAVLGAVGVGPSLRVPLARLPPEPRSTDRPLGDELEAAGL